MSSQPSYLAGSQFLEREPDRTTFSHSSKRNEINIPTSLVPSLYSESQAKEGNFESGISISTARSSVGNDPRARGFSGYSSFKS